MFKFIVPGKLHLEIMASQWGVIISDTKDRIYMNKAAPES